MDNNLSETMLEAAAQRFRVLGEPMRLRILQLLENGELPARAIAETLKTSESRVFRHLLALSQASLVDRRRNGLEVFYAIGDPFAIRICELVFRPPSKEAGPSRRTTGK